MKRSDAPVKQAVPFGVNGQREPILATTPSGDNTASYDVGFPPITMILKSAGGLPPKGQDINQILYELSSLARWQSAGAINGFDSDFSTSIGGYPSNALVIGSDGKVYRSTVDSNLTPPPGSNWVEMADLSNALSRANPFADIKADGNVSIALSNLGLDYGSMLPFGTPLPWPTTTAPSGWLKCNGATFDKVAYPKLAAAYPSGALPDLRGIFLRGWDDGRGVDSGRAILTQQSDAQQAVIGQFTDITVGVNSTASGALQITQLTSTGLSAGTVSTFNQKNLYLDSSKNNRTAAENRPVNTAFNYIVRAA
jgi:microcystin-dependent protein